MNTDRSPTAHHIEQYNRMAGSAETILSGGCLEEGRLGLLALARELLKAARNSSADKRIKLLRHAQHLQKIAARIKTYLEKPDG